MIWMNHFCGMAITPHPPLAIPEVGRGKEKEIQSTLAGFKEIAAIIKSKSPEIIICITPHGNVYQDGICILDEEILRGDLGAFGAGEVTVEKETDPDFLNGMIEAFTQYEIPSIFLSQSLAEEYGASLTIDHGGLVPLYFINQVFQQYKLIYITIGMLSLLELYEIGTIIQQVINQVEKKTFVIVSGDLSHALLKEGPYPYHPKSAEFDRLIVSSVEKGDAEGILKISEELAEAAQECGLRPLAMGLGILEGEAFSGKILSYEGPYGVGYLNAYIEYEGVKGDGLLRRLIEQKQQEYEAKKRTENIYVALARAVIEEWVHHGHQLDWEMYQDLILQNELVEKLDQHRAGVFVSIQKEGDLRGCMGTIEPTQRNIAEEIIVNAIQAATDDPRFYPVRKSELQDLEIKVDLLDPIEEINDVNELDVKKYGVIVEAGGKNGLLLPDLEGIDTVEEQVEIAKSKGGIDPEEAVRLYRFRVTRY